MKNIQSKIDRMADTGRALARLEHVSVVYGSGTPQQYHALQNVSLEIGRGDFVGVVGKSGSGKSTLMKVLGCRERPTEGAYTFDGVPVEIAPRKVLSRMRAHKIAVIPQHYCLASGLPVWENVARPLSPNCFDAAERRRRAMKALREVGLDNQADKLPGQLSGGQQQRAAIARAMVQRPAMVLADEPTGALDLETRECVFRIFQNINSMGTAVVLITHDLNVAARTDRLIRIQDGQICEDRRLVNTA